MQDALDEEVRRLQGEIEHLQVELTDAVRAVEQAHGRADAGAARIAWLEPAVETMRTELAATAGEREAMRERLAAVTGALEQARGDADRAAALGPVLEATREELERVAAERDALALRVAAFGTQLADAVAERESARDIGAGHEARGRELEAQMGALGGQLERMLLEREQVTGGVAHIEAERARALEDRDAARRAAEMAEAQAKAMEPMVIALRAELGRVGAEREALVGRVAALEAALARASSETTPGAGSAARGADATTTASPDAGALAEPAAAYNARPPQGGAAEPAAEDGAPRVWPFQLAAPPPAAGAVAAGAAPITRLPQRRAAVELHFRKPPGWADTVFVHAWTASGPLSVWPGMRMTAEGGGWYGARIEGVPEVMAVFNDSCGHQTGDLRREGDGWFADGEWRSDRPEGVADVLRLADYPARSEKTGPR
jgi:chromosome segregation ATPase